MTRRSSTWATARCVVTTDMLMDGVDFVLGEVDREADRPQGAGRQPERPGGDGGRADGGCH